MDKVFDIFAYLMGKAAGGGGDVTVESKSISSNGTFTAPPGKAYSPVTVDVPNSYAAGDEGKVVSGGQLVSQTAHAEVTQNGTIDTTLNDSVVVNVSGGGGGVATGTVTPAARTLTMSFDAGLSTITGLLIVPESETPLKSGGKTCVGIVYTPNCYYQKIGLTTNNTGASALAPTTADSAISVSVSGTNVTVQVASSTPGYFEAITYRWYAW
jgi:hypothetical protein